MRKTKLTKVVLSTAMVATLTTGIFIGNADASAAGTTSTNGTDVTNTTATGASKINDTMMQGFEWYIVNDGTHWNTIADQADDLGAIGITSMWLPPAYKNRNNDGAGYEPYDLYDLGEFNQKKGIATKYGTKAQYKNAIDALHANGIKVYADVVMNHKASADATELVNAVVVSDSNRNNVTSEVKQIRAYTKFNFAVRKGQYSTFTWDASCFDGVDYDDISKNNGVYLFEGKSWDSGVSTEKGNYDYLMYADVDLENEAVVEELTNWGKWYAKEMDLDGFRIDAVKHMSSTFVANWLENVREDSDKELFAVAENLDGNVNNLKNYISATNGSTTVFDFPLHYNLEKASKQSGNYDMRNILNGTLVKEDAAHAVTFVDNHDTQPGQSSSTISDAFKPAAYTLILTREAGLPCIFYGDYYGVNEKGNKTGFKGEINNLMIARKNCAYGTQHDYFDDADVVGWTREGDSEHANSGLAAVITDGKAGSKKMYVGVENAGEVWKDVTGHQTEVVTIDAQGYGTFKVGSKSNSVYVNKKFVPVNLNDCKVTMSKTQVDYTGKALTPSVKITNGSTTLKANTDYEVVYKNNTNIGTASVTVTGKGKYSGSVSLKFDILPAKVKNFVIYENTTTSLAFKWGMSTGSVSGYKVYRYDETTKKYVYIKKNEKYTNYTYKSTTLTNGKCYKFYVTAYKTVGSKIYESVPSAIFYGATIPNAPKFTLSSASKRITVKLTKQSSVSGYKIYMKISGGKYALKKTLPAGTTTYKSALLKKGKTYYVKVVTYTKTGKKSVVSKETVKSIKVK